MKSVKRGSTRATSSGSFPPKAAISCYQPSMEALDITGLLESIQEMVEKRWGKFWAWIIYVGLLAALVATAIWVITKL